MGELEIRSSADEPGREPGFLNLTGREIGRYRIQQRLGRGGVTTVYQAYDTVGGFAVALKILLHGNDEKLYNRFRHEAQTAARLLHPNIVRTLRVGVTSGTDTAYIAMELVEGEDLAAMLAVRRRFSPEDSCRLIEPIARALAYAHRQGVIHRDVKPSNILLRSVGADTPDNIILDALDYPIVPLLSDFGIARALDAPELTSAGRTIGTPAFMAPEQARGQRDIDYRADIYALGALFYRCITGRQPFTGTTVQILHAHVYEPVTISEEIGRQLSQRHIQILQRSLAKDPADRYQSAEEMAQDLARGIDPAHDTLTASEREADTTITLELVPTVEQPTPTGNNSLLVPAAAISLLALSGKAQPTPDQALSQPLSPPQSTQSVLPSAAPVDPHFDQVLDRRLQHAASTLLSLLLTVITLVVIWLYWGDLIAGALQRFWSPAALIEPPQVLASTIPASLSVAAAPLPSTSTIGSAALDRVDAGAPIAVHNQARMRTLNREGASGAALPMPTAPAPTPARHLRSTVPITAARGGLTALWPANDPAPISACVAPIDARLQPFLPTLTPQVSEGFRCATAAAQLLAGEYLRYEQGYMLYLPALNLILIGYEQRNDGAIGARATPWEVVDLTLSGALYEPQPATIFTKPEDLLFLPQGAFAAAWQRAGVDKALGMARTPRSLAFEAVTQKFTAGWLILDHHLHIGDHDPLYVFETSARIF